MHALGCMHGRVTSLPSEPPRFFNRGPSSIAKLTFFGVISLAVMFIDARFQTLEKVRMAIATVVYPVQQAALLPAQAAARVGELFETRAELRDENERLKSDLLQASQGQQAHIAAKQESERLLKLLQMSQSVPTRAQAAHVVYMGRDAFSQKAFIDRASSQVFEPGSAVVDELGLLGQLTRVHPLFAEVTLLTEKDVTIPVKLERTGTRALLYGRGPGKLPELKHVSNTLDIKEGDILLTSNIDGLFPANVRVAKVASVQRDAESGFARVECTPSANVTGADAVLVLDKPPAPPPRPVADAAPETTGKKRK